MHAEAARLIVFQTHRNECESAMRVTTSKCIRLLIYLALLVPAIGCRTMPFNPESPESAAKQLAQGRLPLMMAGQDHAVVPAQDAYRSTNPLGTVIRHVRDTLNDGAALSPTGVSRDSYLTLASGVVEYFRHFQAADGRIIDPFLHREYQYSTPAYALAAGTLVNNGSRMDLLDSASRALESSLYQLASGTASDRHGDFFILPTMLAYRQLRDRVDSAIRIRWTRYLAMIDPEIAYTDLIGGGQPDVINWNTGAIAGEFLRHQAGFTGLGFVDRYLDAQLPRFTPEGLYRDPGTPLVYDASARFNLLVLLEEGYGGKHRTALEVLLERGAWASLLMQSPSGDSPTGGRSTEHVWNDALACASFELWARRSRASGDMPAARAFKRGAHLAAQSLERWVRPSGEFWIVKNHFDPALRRGFEDYSSHSQYNLLAAAYLAMAGSAADDAIPEGPSPADVGGFVIDLPDFHKIFANSRGYYIEIERAADPHYNSTGLLRVHRRGMDNVLGPTLNAPIQEFPLAVGVAWPAGDGWESLAQFPAGTLRTSTSVEGATPDKVQFSVQYRLTGAAVESVTESYVLTPDQLTVSIGFDRPVDRWKLRFPAFVTDGKETGKVSLTGNTVTVRSGDSAQRFEVLSPEPVDLMRTGRIVEMRDGDYEVIEGNGRGRGIGYRLGGSNASTSAPSMLSLRQD